MKRLAWMLVLLLAGCTINRQTVRVIVTAPPLNPETTSVSATYELDWR
jgi:hypothetical protein